MSGNKNMTSYRWEIADFCKQFGEAYNKKENLVSDVFALVTRPSIQFALFYNPSQSNSWSKDTYGVVLKNCDTDQPLNFDVKIWMENDDGQKFGEYSAQNHGFKTIDNQCEFNVKDTGNDWGLLLVVYAHHKSLFICCELLDLDLDIASITLNPASIENCDDEFHQNQWTLYEEDIYDAMIKVDKKEFKVMKGFFMAQSSVFKKMFLSKFKEGVTNEIQINDVDVETMEHLVKWFYTSKIEDGSPIEKLFSASDKYDVKILKNACIQRMINSFDNSNAFNRLVLSVKHSNEILKNASLNYIAKFSSHIDFMKFFTSSEWKELENKNAKTAHEVMELLQEKMKK